MHLNLAVSIQLNYCQDEKASRSVKENLLEKYQERTLYGVQTQEFSPRPRGQGAPA